ncbi:uncharacterized protein [Drosophila kikkawai]|uniref:Integrase catalytic domain-containing protein n=1 Tax=Drosophila kikkawai TaxID=30033 RepID=A0ABM4GFW4_DROKI
MPTGDEEQTPLIPAITLEGSQSGSPRPDQLKPKAATATPRAKGQEALDTAPSTSSRSTRSVSKMAQKAIDIALKKFIAITDRVSHFAANLHTLAAPDTDRLPPGMCQVHWDKIRALWEKVEKSYESDDPTTIASELEAKYSYCYSVFSKCVFQLQDIIDKAAFQPTQASASSPPTPFYGLSSATSGHRSLHWGLYSVANVPRPFYGDLYPEFASHTGGKAVPPSLTERFENRRLLVNSQLKILFNLPAVPQESGAALKELQGTIQSCLTALSMSSIQVETWDCLLVYMVSTKLPKTTLSMWEQQHNKAEIPTWNELNSFLTERHRTLEAIDDIRPSSSGQVPPRSTPASAPARRLNSYEARVTPAPRGCDLCSRENHPIRVCPRFLEMDVNGRSDYIKRKQLCLNCFARGHQQRDCTSAHSCFTCHSRHHTLLHRGNPFATAPTPSAPARPRPADSPRNVSTSEDHSDVQVCFASGSKAVLLGTALVDICHLGCTFQARALIDSGSEATFITERLFNLVKLPFKTIQAQVSGLNQTIAAQSTKFCHFSIRAPSRPGLQLETAAYVLPQLAGSLPSYPVPPDFLKGLPDIPLADPKFFESSHIDVLIGADILPSVLLGNSKANICGSLFGQETIFGWVLTGPISPNAPRNVSAFSTRVTCGSDDSLDQLLTKFWEVEEGPSQIVSESDSVCERNFVRTTRRDSCGKYVVTLPLRDPEHGGSELSSSRSFALAQFLRNEQRLKRDPPLKARYDSVIQEYLDLGHMAEVSPKSRSATYYLLHHAVLKPESTTTKVRVVFNASSPSANGTSLNDILHAGPVLQSDLTIQILKWRYFRFVFNADIEKMYRQIWVDPNHTPFQRILFRNPEGEIRDYELKTVTFGVNCAPFLAIRVLQQLADDEESRYPRASRIIRQFMYVDDVLAGADSRTEAHVAIRELQGALSSAGFPLRKWTSNDKAILANIPSDHLLHSDFLELDSESTAKTLGVRWKATSDEFFFIPPKLVSESSFTKRQVLSQIAKLFDPAGWLAPFVVRAKMFMQDIWLQDLGWDDTLPQDLYQRWIDFLENYSALDNIRIPRWVTFRPHLSIEHHGFCDASQKAYGAAIYVRVEVGSTVEVTLLTARTRVAPVKTLSLPRLELCGALLLSEMAAAILPKMPGPASALHCWTDSTIVLAWLHKPACHWTTFVANRVTKITQFTEVEKWAHVRSEHNPADLASRGVALQDLADSQLWWHGPAWLRRPRSEWPLHGDVSPITDLEKRAVKVHVAKVPPEDILERFSTLDKALRVLPYVHRFIQRSRKLLSSVEDHLTASEIVSAELLLISVTQRRHFVLEMGCLSQKRQIPTSSLVQNLNPFLDSNGLMRACGRVTTSELLQYDKRHPIILLYDCHLSRLIVHFTHRITLHGGNQPMIRLIRSKFWIPRVRKLGKSVIYSCKVCVIHKGKLQTQLMGDLPKERTSFSRPFAYTGMDYAAPFDIKNYTGRACLITKGYVLVFVCFSTKAIHLEPTSDLTTEKFLAAFGRFVSRRGCSRQVQSDNGKTFVGAAAQLSRDFLHALKEAVTGAYSHHQLLWQFIPPGAPHMGGLWEAGVKNFKTLFYKSTVTRKYTFEELATLLARIEACLNSRPLAPMCEDPADLLALTPGHFLVGGPLLAVVEPEIKGVTTSIINRWQHLKALHQQFRLRWKEEYLKELHKRNKWRAPARDLQFGDMVVVKEDNLPSNEWRLGRIDAVFPGADGHVRVVDIRTARGLIKRPIAKLVLLPTEAFAGPQ